MTCSMSRKGNCYDCAVMESFFSTVKSELGEHFESGDQAQMALFDYIEVFYNQRRRHSTLGQISPAAFERRAAETRLLVTAAPEGVPAEGVVHPAGAADRRSWSLL